MIVRNRIKNVVTYNFFKLIRNNHCENEYEEQKKKEENVNFQY